MKEAPCIYILRHAETDANKSGGERVRGHGDFSLDAHGRAETRKAAKILNTLDIDEIIYSPIRRARETAEIISRTLDVPCVEDAGLETWDTGFLTGILVEKAANGVTYYEQHPQISVPDGEPYADFYNAWLKTFWKYYEKRDGKTRLLVTHGRNTSTLKAVLKRESLSTPDWGRVPSNGSIIEVSGEAPKMKLLSGYFEDKQIKS